MKIQPQNFHSPSNKNKQNSKLKNLNVLRYQDYDTLKLIKNDHYIETDHQFIQDVKKLSSLKISIFGNFVQFTQQVLTDQQCDQIDFKARLHSDANKLNINTLDSSMVDPDSICQCCNKAKGPQFSIFADYQQLQVLGPGTLLYFKFLKFLCFALVIVSLVYGIYALTTNLLGNTVPTQSCPDKYCIYRRISSDQNKLNPNILIIPQQWLGLLSCIIWVFTIRVLKYFGKQTNKHLDDKFTSASDFAIKIQNLPYGQYSQVQLLQYFENLYHKIPQDQLSNQKNIKNNKLQSYQLAQSQYSNKFCIKSIQIVYNMQFCRQMVNQIFYLSKVVSNCLCQNQNKQVNIIKDIKAYKAAKNKLKNTYQLLQDLRKKFLNDSQFRKNLATTCCLVQFYNENDKNLMLRNYGAQKIGFNQQIKQKIKSFCDPSNPGILFKGRVLRIQRAPQPSDILWLNCQKRYSILRKFLIFMVAFVIIAISFGIIIGLDFLQEYLMNNQIDKDSQIITVINITTSLVLLIINQILWFSLYYLLNLQYNHTLTQKIISQMNKSLVSTSINVIILPIIASYFIRKKFYGTDGLAGMIFDYHISMVTIAIVLRFLDPINLLKRVALWIRWTRNIIIRFICAKLTQLKPHSGVYEVNKFYEGHYFDIADYYVTIIGAIYHAVFFIQLQPSIIYLITITTFLFYWVTKYKVLRTSKLPEMTDYLIFETTIWQANMVPIMYGVGSIALSFLSSQVKQNREFSYISSIICIVIGFIGLSNPFNIISKIAQYFIKKCFETKKSKKSEGKINQDYYSDSNSLLLLGFENILIGQSQKPLTHQLKNFCQSFFNKYDIKIQDVLIADLKANFKFGQANSEVNQTMHMLKDKNKSQDGQNLEQRG